jgi:hypothetical protein
MGGVITFQERITKGPAIITGPFCLFSVELHGKVCAVTISNLFHWYPEDHGCENR